MNFLKTIPKVVLVSLELNELFWKPTELGHLAVATATLQMRKGSKSMMEQMPTLLVELLLNTRSQQHT